jgi:hypothetical protein
MIAKKHVRAEIERLSNVMSSDPNWSRSQIELMGRQLNRTSEIDDAEFWTMVGWWEGRIDERDANG